MEISNINITDNTDITDNKEEYISYDCSFNYVFQEEDVRDHFFTSTISKNGNFEIIQVLAPKNKSKNSDMLILGLGFRLNSPELYNIKLLSKNNLKICLITDMRKCALVALSSSSSSA